MADGTTPTLHPMNGRRAAESGAISAHSGPAPEMPAEATFNPSDHFAPSLLDAISHFAKIEADNRDRRLRDDLRKAGVNLPDPYQDEDED